MLLGVVKAMKISVIIVDYLQPEMTKRCIESIRNATFKDLEIITYDNSEKNIGLAAAQNFCAYKAQGEYLFFLNNDTLVKEDIFERLLESKYDCVGCKMFNYNGTEELDSCISLDKFGCPAGNTGPVFYVDGAIFIKRRIFEEIGKFDDKLFLYGEDRDLCWRLWLASYSVGVNSEAVFYHNSSCVEGTNYFRRFHSEKNIIRSMLKNYDGWSLPKIFAQYAFWSILELGYITLTHPIALFKSYFPAYWWNIVNFQDTWRQRKFIVRRVPDYSVPFSRETGKLYVLKTQRGIKWL